MSRNHPQGMTARAPPAGEKNEVPRSFLWHSLKTGSGQHLPPGLGYRMGEVRHPGGSSTSPRIIPARGARFCPSLCPSDRCEQLKVCTDGFEFPLCPSSTATKSQESQETPLCSHLVTASWPRHFLCLVDFAQAGSEAAAKKVFIRKYGSEGNI